MCVHEEHDSICHHRRQLREARVALFRREIRWHGATGERLETQQQPHWIVRDVEYERAICRETQDNPCLLGLMCD